MTMLLVIYIVVLLISIYLFESTWKATQRHRIPNKDLDEAFKAFRRTDAHQWRKWRYYLLILTGISALRVVLGFPFFLSSCLYSTIFLIGHDRRKPITGLRYRIIRIGFYMYSALIVYLITWTRVDHKKYDDYDYSYYLGPDYKKK